MLLHLASVAALLVVGCRGYTRNEQNLISTHYSMNTAGFAYVGCFRDDGANRDLRVFKGDAVDMNPNSCNVLCKGYDYFAVQITQCYCDNRYGSVQEPTIPHSTLAMGAPEGSLKWAPGLTAAKTTVPPTGITSIENGMAQTAYETDTNSLGGVGIIDETNLNKYIQEGCYHDCGGAADSTKCTGTLCTGTMDAGLSCGGLNRNSVYRRPSTAVSDCQSTGANKGHPLLAARGICDPPSADLHVATMPPCKDSTVTDCTQIALGHEDQSFAYSKPWETHHTFQSGHARDNALARDKAQAPATHSEGGHAIEWGPNLDDMLADESYMVHA